MQNLPHTCTDISSGVRLTYWFMNIGLITYWSQSLCDMMDVMQTNQSLTL